MTEANSQAMPNDRGVSLDRHADEVRARFPDIPRRVSGYNLDELLPELGFHVARALVGTEGTCGDEHRRGEERGGGSSGLEEAAAGEGGHGETLG